MKKNELLVALITQLRIALEIARQRLQDERAGVMLRNVEIELSTEITKKVEVGGKLDLGVSIDLSAGTKNQKRNTLTVLLVPTSPVTLGKGESDELADAILAMAWSVKDASHAGSPDFALSEASVTLDVVNTSDGKLKVVAGASGGSENSHKLKLNFRLA
jgi:Trypsin-co-occurring domain 2